MGATPPFDHPHIFIDMGDDGEAICSYCSTRFVYDALARRARLAGRMRVARRRPDRMRRALIAGAGVAGLAAALALAKAGFEAVVFERAAGAGGIRRRAATLAQRDAGAGANSARSTRSRRSPPRRARSASCAARDDAELAALDLTDAAARWGAPYLVIHRADLQRRLVELCAPRAGASTFASGPELVGYGANADKVQATVRRGLRRR